MKRILLLLLAVSLVSLVGAIPLTHLPPVYSVDITAPGNGEEIDGGKTYRIEWNNTDAVSFAAVHYSENGGKNWETLYPCNKNGKRYDWAVPEDSTLDALIKVEVWGDCSATLPLATDTIEFEVEWTPPQRPCECDSCLSCSNMLGSPCDTVYLGEDIHGASEGQCVNFDDNGKTFDCEGRKITGGAIGKEFYYGVFAGGDDVTIKNCEIREFEVGIDFHGVDGGLIINNTLLENYGSGMFIADSDDIDIEDNTVEDSGQGIFLGSTQRVSLEGNRICGSTEGDIFSSPWNAATGSTRSDNTCDVIYNWNNDDDVTWCDSVCNAGASTSVGSATGLQGVLDGEYGTVELTGNVVVGDGLSVDASHVTINCNGHKITGSGSGTGILMVNRVNNELRDCVIEHFDTGVELRGTSHSRILSNEIGHNDYGLIIRSDALPSRSNTIDGNTIKPNSIYGVYLDGESFDNTFIDNTLLGQRYSLYTSARCDNSIDTTNIGGLIKKIGYFHDASGLTIDSTWGYRDFSELILCNVRDSEFYGASVNNGATGSDGVLIIDSENVEFTTLNVGSSYQGVTITNSSGVSFQGGAAGGFEQDCFSISQSSDIGIDNMDVSECDTGFSLAFSEGCAIENLNLYGMRIAGISLHDSDGNEINRIKMDGGANETKGLVMTEDSNDNEVYMADFRNLGTGMHIDDTSDGNQVRESILCDNVVDIVNYGNNTGSANNCTMNSVWKDDGVGRGCAQCCSNIRSDIDEDGIDDACDCNDLLRGHNEFDTDCGGRCPDCVTCTWCDSKVEPLRIRGGPNSGHIDIMFVPEEDFEGNFSGFLDEVKDTVRMRFLGLKDTSMRPIYEGYEDMFNFYVYTGGHGKTTGKSAYYCYNPEGPEGNICILCSGWLPGEKKYFDWVYSCSFACAFSLGLACGCLAYEPDHFWDHASFVDSAGILTERDIRGCSLFGPTSHYSGSYCGNRGIMVIHETGHSLFSLSDQYCGDTAYSRASQRPNIWNSMGDCQSAAASGGWTNGTCRQIRDGDCSKDKYRYDSDAPMRDIMAGGCWSGSDAKFKEADVRRINYVFEHWPSGGSKGIISYVDFRNSTMKHLLSTVLPNHPDLGMWGRDFSAVTQSAGGEEIDSFSFGDPRRANTGEGAPLEGDVFVSETAFSLIVPMHENVRWLHIFNGTSGDEMVAIDLGPAIWNYCNESAWEDEYCRTVDLNDNGIPDYQEDWSLEEAIEVMKEPAPEAGAPDLDIVPETAEPPKPEWVEKLEKPVVSVGGMDLNPIILLLVLVIFMLLGFFLMKRARKKTKKESAPPQEPGVCKKCGAQIEPGSKFCPQCGEVVG